MADWKSTSRYQKYFLDIYSVYKGREDVKAFLELVLTIGTIAFFIVFALRPTLLTIIGLQKSIEVKSETITKLDTKIENLNRAQKILADKTQEFDLLSIALPDNALPDKYLAYVESLAKKHDVGLTKLTMENVPITDNATASSSSPANISKKIDELPINSSGINFEVAVNGTYQNMILFAQDLENTIRPIWVDSLSVSSLTTKEGKTLTLSVSGRVVYVKKNE